MAPRREVVPAVPGEGAVVGSLRPLLQAVEAVIRMQAISADERVPIWYITYSVFEEPDCARPRARMMVRVMRSVNPQTPQPQYAWKMNREDAIVWREAEPE
jgi:hypothetical protein